MRINRVYTMDTYVDLVTDKKALIQSTPLKVLGKDLSQLIVREENY